MKNNIQHIEQVKKSSKPSDWILEMESMVKDLESKNLIQKPTYDLPWVDTIGRDTYPGMNPTTTGNEAGK